MNKSAVSNITNITTSNMAIAQNTVTGNRSLHIDHNAICNYFGLDLVTRANIIALLK